MRIVATDKTDYLLFPDYSELTMLGGVLRGLVPTQNGLTFSAYSEIPDYLIKGCEFFEVKAKRTTFVRSKTDFLNELDLYFCVLSGSIQKKSEIREINSFNITYKNTGFFEANHIPQIFYPFMDGYISSIDGDVDLSRMVFRGKITVKKDENT